MSQAINQVIPEGYKQTDVGVIPNDWHVNTLEKVTKNKRPISYGIVQTGPEIYDGVPCLRVLDIVNGTINTSNLIHTTAQISNSYKRTQLKVNDLVIPLRGKVGEVGLIETKLVGANLTRGVALIALEEEHSPQFFKQALCSEGSKNRLLNSMNGSALQEISIGTLRSFKLAMPKLLEEQTAIANALSDVDALLTELENLIAKKQAIKTATMQQLLTGKTRLPQFAFYSDIKSPEDAVEGKHKHSSAANVNVGASDDGALASQESGGMDSRCKGTKTIELGEIPEDWEVRNLPEVVWYQEGPGLRNWQFTNKGLKVINVTNLQESGFLNLDKTDRHITWEEYEKTYKHFSCDVGDLVIASSGNSYCKSSIVRQTDLPLLMNTSVIRFKAKQGIDRLYMTVYLRSKFFKDQIDLMITGGAQPNFGPFHLNKVLIPLPTSKEEQTVIATILTDMDNEIQTLEQRLSKTRQIKQGMMQELLTGKTRLPFTSVQEVE